MQQSCHAASVLSGDLQLDLSPRMKYSLSSIVRAIREPRFATREINRIGHTRFGKYKHNPKGIDIFKNDWDNLIILDACRYDEFVSASSDWDIDTVPKYSQASLTEEFVRANFSGRKLHDTVYVSANSWYLRIKEEIDSEVHRFVDLQSGRHDVEWVDEPLRVVTPETVTRFAEEAAERHPNKRLIVHYLQPHHPFVGPTGTEHFSHQSNSLQEVYFESDASDDLLRDAYRENLEIVIDAVRQLVPELTGRTIITADHGEMLGDRHSFIPMKDYGHHRGIFNDANNRVPWTVIESDQRKEIVESTPQNNRDVDTDKIDEQLRNLGYKL